MKRRRAKKTAVVPPVDLPAAYGQTRLTLLDVDPFHVHAAWEITPRARAAAEEKFTAPATAFIWVLRFHDERAGSAFDIPINPDAHSWYVELLAADKTYHAELGPYSASGDFVAICRSNTITTPPAAPAPSQEPQWLAVIDDLEKAQRVAMPEEEQRSEVRSQKSENSGAQLEPTQAAPLDDPQEDFPLAEPPHAEVITPAETVEALGLPAAVAVVLEEKSAASTEAARPASSDTVNSFSLGGGAAKATIELELNAEVIVYGRAQPGQTLCVNGRPVPVNADGTFHVRWALPVAKP